MRRRIAPWCALLLLLASAVALHVGDWTGKGETPQPPATPPPPESVPAADVFVLRNVLREPVFPSGGFIESGMAFEPAQPVSDENIEPDGSEPEGPGEASPLAVTPSRTFVENAMLALSGDIQDPLTFPYPTLGMFAGAGSTSGSPDDFLDAVSEIADSGLEVDSEAGGDPTADLAANLLTEILDPAGDTSRPRTLEDPSTDRPLPLVEIPGLAGLVGPADVAFDLEDQGDLQDPLEPSTPVPEPGTLLLVSGAIGAFAARRRRLQS